MGAVTKGWEVHEDQIVTTANPQEPGEQVTLSLRKGRHTPKNEAEELLLRIAGATPPDEEDTE